MALKLCLCQLCVPVQLVPLREILALDLYRTSIRSEGKLIFLVRIYVVGTICCTDGETRGKNALCRRAKEKRPQCSNNNKEAFSH